MKRIALLMAGLFAMTFAVLSQATVIEEIRGAQTVNAFEARILYERGALFVDVRDNAEWQLGHIRSAVHMDLKSRFNDLYMIETLDRDTPIVIYCNSAHCYRSAVATFLAVSWGYQNIYYFKDGYFSWMAMDYPVSMTSTTPESIIDYPKSEVRDTAIAQLNAFHLARLSRFPN